MPCAASPPSTFCQEKVTTSHLDHSIGCAKAPLVASLKVMPSRSAGIQSKFGILAPEVVPFCVKMMSAVVARQRQIRQHAVGTADVNAAIVRASAARPHRSPILRRSSPRRTRRPARAPSIDHIAISTAPVSDAGTIAILKSAGTPSSARVRSIASLSLAFAGFGAVRAAEQRALQRLQIPAGTFLGRARRKSGISRTDARQRYVCHRVTLPSLQMSVRRWERMARRQA